MEMYNEIIGLLNNSFIIFSYSLIGGLLPSLFWLWFWLQEDNKHKEPRKVIFLTFLLGMCGVFVSFFLQKAFAIYFNMSLGELRGHHNGFVGNHVTVNLIFVIIEEFVKYIAAYMIFFRTKLFNEPIDAFLYLMTAAIGFAAMENSLYLIGPLIEGQTLSLIINGNMRFIGANVLHVASSGLLSLFIGWSFCKGAFVREVYVWFGLILAVLLHWAFNYVLITAESSIVLVFSAVWVVTIFIIVSLEKMKRIKCEV
jgi:RsiW-degrading membrane proteinase PrsW (M82 family)